MNTAHVQRNSCLGSTFFPKVKSNMAEWKKYYKYTSQTKAMDYGWNDGDR